MTADLFSRPSPIPRIIGVGLVALDVIIRDGGASPPTLRAGGTCGNVLAALSYLGWRASPVARLKDDEAGEIVRGDLARWGVEMGWVATEADGSTPVFVQNITSKPGGDPSHSFSRRCPDCGGLLPGYKAVTASVIEQLLPSITGTEVFFFDRVSRGSLTLARHCADRGALVMFEPSGVGDVQLFNEALQVSHVVKYSRERLGEERALLECDVPLHIETLGKEGVRYRLSAASSSCWKQLAAFDVETVLDTSGAGDWCSAGVLHALGRDGLSGLQEAIPKRVGEAIRFGMAFSAWNCGFEGARGGMYEVTRNAFRKQVEAIVLQGRAQRVAPAKQLIGNATPPGNFCSLCSAR